MEIQLSCQHTTLTESLRSAVTERFQRLAQHTNLPTSAHVVLVAKDGGADHHKAEATLLLNGKPLHASFRSSDMYVAIDGLVSRLDRQLRKAKTARISERVSKKSLKP